MTQEADVVATFTIAGDAAGTSAGSPSTSRGRIAAVTADALTLTLSSPPQIDPAHADRAWATVTIHGGSHELVFFAPVRSLTPGTALEPSTVALKLPTEIIATRRRRSFRSPAAATDGIQLRLWRINEHAILSDRPRASQSFACDLHELSIDGFGATLHARQIEAMRLVAGQRFRVELLTADAEMIFEARLVHPKASARDDASVRCGFSFVAHENDFEYRRSRQKLDSALARLQQRAAASASARKSA